MSSAKQELAITFLLLFNIYGNVRSGVMSSAKQELAITFLLLFNMYGNVSRDLRNVNTKMTRGQHPLT